MPYNPDEQAVCTQGAPLAMWRTARKTSRRKSRIVFRRPQFAFKVRPIDAPNSPAVWRRIDVESLRTSTECDVRRCSKFYVERWRNHLK
jgi:hypothetical protein